MSPAASNQAAFSADALTYLVGGVSSSFRINPYTGRPLYIQRADGPYLHDIEGRRYIDFFMGHGACPLGHNRPEIRQALAAILEDGVFAEFDHPLTVALAKKIVEHVPCAEQVRYVNSGSEGTLLSLRLARGYTGRTRVVRVDGHFHGGHDYVLGNNLASKTDRDNPGDRLSKIGPLSAGIPDVIRETLFLVPWNRPEVIERLAGERGDEIAAILMNPIDYNNGCVTTTTEYLQAVRDICDRHGIVLIFDEILSGFRTGLSCAQGYYGVTPDVCLLGKALSNGVPIAAIAGKERIMRKVMDPEDPVVAGGTFSGNLMGCAAGLAAFSIMEAPDFFPVWLRRAGKFLDSLQSALDEEGFPARVQYLGCNFFIYVGTREPIREYRDLARLNAALARTFFQECIERGVYFHTDFTVSAMHDDAVLAEALNQIRSAAREALCS
ncbi:MAG: aminotransferase class III-fold pyridoxal phosphate-dependent enzyme [Candidatus Hydrogenedentes bacterium]|nr:aminotransferase class III-fold pyridoxal phosphate-dependent enzyme [Candidatus Hydrogenedentota bacterium]